MHLALIIVGVVVLAIVLILIALLIYVKLTCGYCKSKKRLDGKVVIVTGANAGIGYETAKDLANRGARVIMACRSEQRAVAARDKIIEQTGNPDVHFRKLDLTSLSSVRAFADDILKTEKRLDILINNAGIPASEYKLTEDGLLLEMQSNHFGPFLLTNLLLPLLKSSAPSRIVNLSSIAHLQAKLDLDNINLSKETYTTFVYGQTKLCNVLMTVELARRLQSTGVTANSLHPGVVNTELAANIPGFKYIYPVLKLYFKTPLEGAQTSIYLAVSPEVEGVSGHYFSDCRQTSTSAQGRDENLARRLWEVSEKVVKLNDHNNT